MGRTFLLPLDENGERKRATFSEHVNVLREDQLRFKLKIDGDQLDDLISYSQLMEYLGGHTDTGPLEDGFYRFKCITDLNLLIKWERGEQTWETLSNILVVYAKNHDLLNTPGWKLSKRHSKENIKWKEATYQELEQIKEYQVFKDFGRAKAVYDKKHITNESKGHQKIRVHFVFNVKHCGKFKARLLADGQFTKEPMETVYSGMFLAEPNTKESCA